MSEEEMNMEVAIRLLACVHYPTLPTLSVSITPNTANPLPSTFMYHHHFVPKSSTTTSLPPHLSLFTTLS